MAALLWQSEESVHLPPPDIAPNPLTPAPPLTPPHRKTLNPRFLYEGDLQAGEAPHPLESAQSLSHHPSAGGALDTCDPCGAPHDSQRSAGGQAAAGQQRLSGQQRRANGVAGSMELVSLGDHRSGGGDLRSGGGNHVDYRIEIESASEAAAVRSGGGARPSGGGEARRHQQSGGGGGGRWDDEHERASLIASPVPAEVC